MMSINTIHVPNIGKEKLEVIEILVKIGDNININQPLVIIEGDKTSMEIPSTDTGIVTKIHINVGDAVCTGSLILSVDTDQHINIEPTDNKESIFSNNLSESNSLKKYNTIENSNKIIDKPKNSNISNLIDNNTAIIHATPLIRNMARTLNIDLSKIKGSGRKGRILKEDIQNYLNVTSTKNSNPLIESHQPGTQITSQIQTNYHNISSNDTVIELSKIQKISGINLQKNWVTIPHVTQFDTIDVTNLENFRKQQNLEIEKKKINCKITMLIFIMKAVSKALAELPRFNSILSEDGNKLILKKNINIGIAVDTENGLFVPVIRDVNKKGIIQLAQELTKIIKKARFSKHQLTPIDMQEGSFTISNLGSIGGGIFTPIINAPEVAILGISKSSICPIWNGKKIVPRLMLPLSLSYDHRVIDGVYGAKFITLINKIISDIRLLSM